MKRRGRPFFFLSILNVDGANEVCNNVVDGAVVSVSSRDVCCFWKLSIQNDEAADAWQLNSSFYLFIFVTEDAFKEPARSFSLFLSLFCPYLSFFNSRNGTVLLDSRCRCCSCCCCLLLASPRPFHHQPHYVLGNSTSTQANVLASTSLELSRPCVCVCVLNGKRRGPCINVA